MSHNDIQQIQDLNETPIPLWRIPAEIVGEHVTPETCVEVEGCRYLVKAYSYSWHAYIAKRLAA